MEKWVIHGEWNPMVVHLTVGWGNERQLQRTPLRRTINNQPCVRIWDRRTDYVLDTYLVVTVGYCKIPCPILI